MTGLSLPWLTLLTFQDEFEMLLPQRHLLLRPACFPVLILVHSSPLLLLLVWGPEWQSVCHNRHVVVQWAQGVALRSSGVHSKHLHPRSHPALPPPPRPFTRPRPQLGVLVPRPFPLSHAEGPRRRGCFCFAFILYPTAQHGASYLVSTQKYL